MLQLLFTVGNSLVEKLRCPHQEEAQNIPEEIVAPQVPNYSKFSKMQKESLVKIFPVVIRTFI